MTAVTTYSTPIAAGATVHARAEVHMSTKGGTYQAAVHAVLNADPDLAKAYALPATRVIAKPLRPAAPVVPAPVRLTQGTPGDTVHLRAVTLTEENPRLGYRAAMKQLLTDDPTRSMPTS